MPQSPQPRFRRDYRPAPYAIERVDLCFEIRPGETTVVAKLSVRRNSEVDAASADLVLDGESLHLLEISLDGHPLDEARYRVAATGLTLLRPPASFELRTVVRISPENNSALSGLYRSSDTYCTQCEAEGFRRITFFLDRPDIMSVYRTRIEADKISCPVLLSNGNRVASGDLEGGRHWVQWEDPSPKPSYLFALVAGNLRCHRGEHTTPKGRRIELEIWVDPSDLAHCGHALSSLKKAMRWDEENYGLEYELDIYMIVAVSDFNMGAMENKGLNVFNTKYVLADPATATDDDYENIEAVIAHEYFHNWTGNRVTCRDWFQLTLKEGLTVFRDQSFTADLRSDPVKRILDVKTLRAVQFAEDAGPMRHPIRPESYIEMNNFYTVTVYNKGAEVVRMYRTLLGRDGFRKGMDTYFARHDGHAVTCDDFRAAMADANETDLRQFERWYDQAGTPILRAEGRYHPQSEIYELDLEQIGPQGEPLPEGRAWHVPIAMGLLDADGQDIPLRLEGEVDASAGTRVLELRRARQTFRFTRVKDPPTPSLLRGFSAPVQLRSERSREDLAFLMRHDSDRFNRWDAGQTLATSVLLEMAGQLRNGVTAKLDPLFLSGFEALLDDTAAEGSWLALALTLPDEHVLGQAMDIVDVDNLHLAREAAQRELSELFGARLTRIYADNHDATYSSEKRAIDRRRLKNTALRYLTARGTSASIALAWNQFEAADNMSDSEAALAQLLDMDTPERDRALAVFYARWREVPLALDKWFSLQALPQRIHTVARVRTLLSHDDFNLSNPNRVRSLVQAFSTRNQVGFHSSDGAGYALLADVVVAVDAKNPQLAARLSTGLSQWRRFDGRRSKAMKTQLERIAARPQVSRDVFEIAGRALGRMDR
ncbi:MAG: aminopeptidase N [Nannocystaceae bacterium]